MVHLSLSQAAVQGEFQGRCVCVPVNVWGRMEGLAVLLPDVCHIARSMSAGQAYSDTSPRLQYILARN